VGNVTEVDDAHPVAGGVVTFTYDALDRLTDASGLYDAQYEYNEIGNLTNKAGITLTYPATEQPRPHGVISS
jgi:YD repeat-containing protein